MNDIVRVSGRFRNTPLFVFEQKGQGVTSITGEKLYEAQLLDAIKDVALDARLSPIFIMALADVKSSRYQLYIESKQGFPFAPEDLEKKMDTAIGARNIEYHEKRASGRLQALQLHWLRPGAFEAYKKHCIRSGQREGQFKIVALQYLHQFAYSFRDWLLPSKGGHI